MYNMGSLQGSIMYNMSFLHGSIMCSMNSLKGHIADMVSLRAPLCIMSVPYKALFCMILVP